MQFSESFTRFRHPRCIFEVQGLADKRFGDDQRGMIGNEIDFVDGREREDFLIAPAVHRLEQVVEAFAEFLERLLAHVGAGE